MYSVRFQSAEDINISQIQVGRQVYHLPKRSHYVFPRALAMLKGSDASNIHDEEPAIADLEYSDDEAERAAKERCFTCVQRN
jgi:H/ACA ribonucleoprotein complex non-core subunit NAF1